MCQWIERCRGFAAALSANACIASLLQVSCVVMWLLLLLLLMYDYRGFLMLLRKRHLFRGDRRQFLTRCDCSSST